MDDSTFAAWTRRHLRPLDGQGVVLAAVQALAAQLDSLRLENATLRSRTAALEAAGN